MITYDEVFWLNVTNLVLGLVTLICVLAIGYAVFVEIKQRKKARATGRIDDHSLVVTGLGITMADGGQRVDEDQMLVVSEDGIVETTPKENAEETKPVKTRRSPNRK